MALPKFTVNMNIIAALTDEPNDVDGLSASGLKAKFDEAGKLLQEYINNTLLPKIESDIESAALGVSGSGAILGSALADGAVTTAKLANGAVTHDKLANNTITDAKLSEKCVSTAKLGDRCVTEGKLADGAVTTAKLANGAVNVEKLFTGAVSTDKLGSKAVTEAKYADASIPTRAYKDASVTRAKLAQDALYSPYKQISNATSYTITVSDIGKMIGNAWNADLDIIIPASILSSIPYGAEFAFLRWGSGDATVTIAVDGEQVLCVAGDSTFRKKVKIPDPFGMVAVKRFSANNTGGWVVTGNVEVVA